MDVNADKLVTLTGWGRTTKVTEYSIPDGKLRKAELQIYSQG